MEEVTCDDCGCHLAWMNYCGPRGSIICDDCHDIELQKKSEEQEHDD